MTPSPRPVASPRAVQSPRPVQSLRPAAADGTELATDLCLPDGPGPFPAVLLRTPYDRRSHHGELRGWARHGFAAVAQDVRGRHASGGTWRPYRHEAADGAATLRWLRGRPWSDGRVVAAGGSYAAHCALAPALAAPSGGQPDDRPDAVLAAVPALGAAETAREPSGPERLLSRAGWWAAHGDRHDSDDQALDRALTADPHLLEALPLTGLPARLGRDLPSWPALWRADRAHGLLDRAGHARIPLLAVGGTHDAFAADTLRLWQRWGGPSARLLLGPWGHALTADPGPDATPAHALPLGRLQATWARAALDGQLRDGRYGALALGGSALWLPAAAARTDPASGTALHFDRPGGLQTLRGASFLADPARPARSDTLTVPTDGTPDRLLLAGAPLPQPLDLLGTAEVRFRAVSNTAHADWAARLVALAPDGTARALATGVVRHHHPPGRAGDVTVTLGPLGCRLPAATRLRLEVLGHHFPAHARNPHTGEAPVTATRLLPSQREVHTGQGALWLPALETRDPADAVDPRQEICR
ncbi:CocE/NonD family hydrolase [Streptomyces sp. 549]|uniref:CocE/NonD family hydrolase n=1 Tax=Streptomyces sp. 549 TaxID=3049076 RepID=UPI0024C35B4F|nr:CocE/NonD family hydrolase [Streptomyces sp. 549]MDK1475271.1 CocE/NonD family hydrolase [Streptomyces sp. 549]